MNFKQNFTKCTPDGAQNQLTSRFNVVGAQMKFNRVLMRIKSSSVNFCGSFEIRKGGTTFCAILKFVKFARTTNSAEY
jgi:hypothetical protein